MVDLNEARRLRDKILRHAPEIYSPQTAEEMWAVALLCAEAYFKAGIDGDPVTKSTVDLYRNGASPQYIAYVQNNSYESVVRCLNAAGFPVPQTDEAVDLEFVNMAVLDAAYFPESKQWLVDRIRQMAEEMHYKTVDCLAGLNIQYRAVRAMAEGGYSYGDISLYTRKEVSLIATTMNALLTTADASALQEIVEDWMFGKSVLFIALKHNKKIEEICEALNSCGYITLDGIECNIYTINTMIEHFCLRTSIMFGDYYKQVPKRKYLCFEPTITGADTPVVKKLIESGYPDDRLALSLGYEDMDKMSSELKSLGIR